MSKKRRNLVNDMKYHYTYRITNTKEGMHYYGAHSCDCLPKEDIGVKYWSSTKREGFVEHQKQNPEQYKYKIIKIFSTRVQAVEHEIFLHKKFDVKLHQKFYNDANQTSTNFDTTGKEPWNKGLNKETSDIILKSSVKKTGYKHTDQAKEKIKKARVQQVITEEHKSNISKSNKGKINTEEHNLKIMLAKKDTIFINKDGKVKSIKEDILEIYLKDNWCIGRLEHPFAGHQHTDERNFYMSELFAGENNPFYGKTHTEEVCKMLSENQKGRIVITNGIIEKRIHPEQLENYNLDEWRLGRKPGIVYRKKNEK